MDAAEQDEEDFTVVRWTEILPGTDAIPAVFIAVMEWTNANKVTFLSALRINSVEDKTMYAIGTVHKRRPQV